MEIQPVPSTQAPLELLLEADPSPDSLRGYLPRSRCYVARDGDELLGAYVLQPRGDGIVELMSIAVASTLQGQGIGSALLRHAIATAAESDARRLELGTGTFGYQLAFYQRAGFRVVAVERDYFLTHYAEPIYEDGIQHKDRLRLTLDY
ncbi:GNAT family N-acetyltransferase [Halomonas kalidii]|uniref:GNAT family N-acetyltransferase n=1 Tax=Halomonas kalidii TaxID=3043293 RepID=A0ABT6VNX4_9GAMM|nr:GNAT family N-acetyltransferase [Halomonas kalidii]MDI5935700.1 GNAT family N-acetyltransferase [Halomonas kalidii]